MRRLGSVAFAVALPVIAMLGALINTALGLSPPRSVPSHDSAPGRNCKNAWRVSFPQLHLEAGERIVGLQLQITAGRIVAVDSIPADWSVSTDGSSAAQCSISGVAAHGTGALFSRVSCVGLSPRAI